MRCSPKKPGRFSYGLSDQKIGALRLPSMLILMAPSFSLSTRKKLRGSPMAPVVVFQEPVQLVHAVRVPDVVQAERGEITKHLVFQLVSVD